MNDTLGSDGDFLDRIAAGDEQAFTTFYRRYQARIYRFALQISGNAQRSSPPPPPPPPGKPNVVTGTNRTQIKAPLRKIRQCKATVVTRAKTSNQTAID